MRSALEWTLAMALCVGHNFIGVRSYILLDRYSGYADHFNTVGVIFALFWVALTALLLALIRPFLRLPTSTFALIYAALMVATVMPTMGFGGYFIPLLAGVFYYATPENNWRELLWDHIPDWAAPRDLEMIRNLFEGAPEGAPLPWDAWLGPSVFWGLFMVAFFLVSFSLIALLHHQWASGERLVYPLAVVPTAMVESVENPAKSLFRNPLFWIGFFIAAIIPTVNMLDQVFDFETINNFGIPSTRIFLLSRRCRRRSRWGRSSSIHLLWMDFLKDQRYRQRRFLVVGLSVPAQPQCALERLALSHPHLSRTRPVGLSRRCRQPPRPTAPAGLSADVAPADGGAHLPDPLVAVDVARLPQRPMARYRQRRKRSEHTPALAAHLGADGRRRLAAAPGGAGRGPDQYRARRLVWNIPRLARQVDPDQLRRGHSIQESAAALFRIYHGSLRRRGRVVFGLFVLLLLTAHLLDSADFRRSPSAP